MQYKLRHIVRSNSKRRKQATFGVTIPDEVALFFKDVLFTVERSGTCIILKSGCSLKPTKEEIEKYDFSDCRI